jgi:DTW domain-containing protein YfiP
MSFLSKSCKEGRCNNCDYGLDGCMCDCHDEGESHRGI